MEDQLGIEPRIEQGCNLTPYHLATGPEIWDPIISILFPTARVNTERGYLVAPGGVEPTASGVSSRRSSTELRCQNMAGLTGLEPATSCVTGRCSNQLNYRTNCLLV